VLPIWGELATHLAYLNISTSEQQQIGTRSKQQQIKQHISKSEHQHISKISAKANRHSAKPQGRLPAEGNQPRT
jgi:hypothetical protein